MTYAKLCSHLALERQCEVCELTAALARSEAGAAELRQALDDLADHHCGGVCSDTEEARGYPRHSDIMAAAGHALATDAGLSTLARVEVLERVAGAAREWLGRLAVANNSADPSDAYKARYHEAPKCRRRLADALDALDRIGGTDGNG